MKLPALWGIRISLFLSVFILPACGRASNPEESEEPTRDREELPIMYSMAYGRLSDKDEWLHEYGEGMPKRRIVEEFLAARRTQPPPKDSAYARVDLLPSVNAQVIARPNDFFLEGTDLVGFINYYVEGKANRSLLPERQVDVLRAQIQTDLSELSRMLGVDPPRVSFGRYCCSPWQVDPLEAMEVRRALETNDIVYDASPEAGIELEKAKVCEIIVTGPNQFNRTDIAMHDLTEIPVQELKVLKGSALPDIYKPLPYRKEFKRGPIEIGVKYYVIWIRGSEGRPEMQRMVESFRR